MIGILKGASDDVSLVEDMSTLSKALRSIAKLTATEMLSLTGGLKPYMSKTEAYKMYGRGTVDKWISEGHLKISQDEVGTSSKMRINRGEIEALAEADDLLSHQIKKDNEARRKERVAKSAQRIA